MARVRRGGTRTVPLLAAVTTLVLATSACTPFSGSHDGRNLPYSHPAPPDGSSNRVGALFVGAVNGPRACTASIVDSPHHNLLVTAAHCVFTGVQGRLDGLVFAPAFRNGDAPYGSWPVTGITVDQHWMDSEDPEYDVAFATVDALDGRQIQDVLGGNPLATDQGYDLPVSVTGYPNESQSPITCSGRTSRFSATQERFDCHGYSDGTSGSPWLTHSGQVVGVIGGYQQGGDTDETSYSITFDSRVTDLYRQATTA